MTPIGLFVLVGILAIVLAGSRRVAALGFVAGILFLTQGVATDIAGINFFAFRFVGLAAFIRVVLRGEYRPSPIPAIDKLFVTLSLFTAIIFVIRSEDDHTYHIGRAADAILGYIACRGLLQNIDDVRSLLRGTAVLLIPYSFLVLAESVTGRNPYSLLGRVDSAGWEREGRLRCIASFRHPSILGGVGALFLAIFGGLWFNREDRKRAAIGILCSLVIVWGSNSGGPLSSAAVAMVGWMLWPYRTRLRLIQYSLLGLFLLAAAFMKAPIWYLPTRVSGIVGGSGWHRSYLIEQAMNNLDKWWLVGMPITGTASWFPYVIKATGGADITNQFLVFGLTAGLGAMIMFIAVIVVVLRHLGRTLDTLFSAMAYTRAQQSLVWGLGVGVVVHLANWFGISYFDQSYSLWILHVAAVVAVATLNPFGEYVRLDQDIEPSISDDVIESAQDRSPMAGNPRAYPPRQ